jgi:signal transduction histidine kinase/DNA-binding response OmpR family regulator
MSSQKLDSLSKSPRLSEAAVARAHVLFENQLKRVAIRTDRLLAWLIAAEWIGTMITAWLVSPRAWSGAASTVHIHVVAAIGLGAMVTAPGLVVAYLNAGSKWSRHIISAAQMLMGLLLIDATGGRIETHFYIFGSLAFVAFYRDWRVIVTASLVVVVDHLWRGLLMPESIYGVTDASVWRSLEHGFWVFFEDIFLVASCVQGQREMRGIAARHAELELKMDTEARYIAAQEANRVKSEFLANMSHEVRTPMGAIQGFADLLLDPALSPSERLNHTQVIRRNTAHLLTILNDVLDLSKIEAGKMAVESLQCSPGQIAREVASLMRVRATDKKLDFALVFDTKIPSIIESDPTRLRQILLNLVGNAIKFTSEGRVCVRVACENELSLSPTLSFAVVDTGIGLTKEERERLFHPFSQADASTTRKYGGSGLGLAICAQLAKLLGGSIEIESASGKGSTFVLRIRTGPLLGVPMLANPREALEKHVAAAPEATEPKITLRGSILLAEDGRDNQLLITTFLRKAGAVVEVAENGRIAVDKALAARAGGTPFDVILMDMQMPEMDGYAATSRLRLSKYAGPIIALTAHAMASDRAQCIAAGCDEYLSKPITRATLLTTVRDFIDASARRPAAGAMTTEGDASAPLVTELAADDDLADAATTFAGALPERASEIIRVNARAEWSEVRTLAHQLKGAAGSFGFPSITRAAARVEEVVATGEPNDRQEADRRTRELATLCRRAALDPRLKAKRA